MMIYQNANSFGAVQKSADTYEKQWTQHRSLLNLGPMIYPLFFNISNVSAEMMIHSLQFCVR